MTTLQGITVSRSQLTEYVIIRLDELGQVYCSASGNKTDISALVRLSRRTKDLVRWDYASLV